MSLAKRLKSIWLTLSAAPSHSAFGRPRIFALTLAIAAGMVWLSGGCASVAPVIKIGLVAPFEGRHRSVGYDVIYSARLAIREANASGGIGAYRVSLVALDDFGDSEIAPDTAASLVIDPGVVAAVGHWLPETTDAAETIYRASDLPFVAAGKTPLGAVDPASLPDDFRQAYAAVTPFDEEAGPYAQSGYDSINLILAAMAVAWQKNGTIDRQGVASALSELTYEGLTGPVSQPSK
jgi:ABC-type branched-subunit amino acid transport system substrate-binding protein